MKLRFATLTLLVSFLCQTPTTKSEDAIATAFAKLIQQINREQQSSNYDDTIVNKHSEFQLPNYDEPRSRSSSPHLGETYMEYVTATTPVGEIMGTPNSLSLGFYGIPFAKPPIGKLRFKDPEAPEPFAEPFNATYQGGRMCHQILSECQTEYCDMSEDCLVLNIDVPRSIVLGDTDPVFPVLVWIHGGFFYQGRGTTPKTDGRWLSEVTDAIVVTINYRLGPFGFMVLEEGGKLEGGNQGIKDQQMALEWVQENIGSFGGDKNKVTLFGNSAGCQSSNFHLISSKSEPLFAQVISQSSPVVFSYQSKQESLQITQRQMEAVNCTTNECLRDIDATTLTNSLPRVIAKSLSDGDFFGTIEPFRPIIDGQEFTDQPINVFQRGEWQNYKPVIIGSTEEEMGWISAIFENFNITETMFTTINTLILGARKGREVSQKYINSAPANTVDFTDVFAQEVTDLFFTCPNRALARFASQSSQSQPNPAVYLYIDAHPLEGDTCEETVNPPSVCGYSYHSSEIAFVFNSAEGYELTFSEADKIVSSMFNTYWGNFAHKGDPNSSGHFTQWPTYEKRAGKWPNIVIKSPQSELDSNFREDFCDMWDDTGFYLNVTAPASSVAVTTTSDVTTTTGDVTTTTTVEVTTTTVFQETDKTTTGGALGLRSRFGVVMVFAVIIFNQIL